AAMGACPSFISIGLTADSKDIQWYKNFTIGTEQILKDFNLKLVGGDITYGELNICVNVFGYPYKKPLTRSNAQVGDDIYITGKLGLARQGLKDFKLKKKSEFINYYFKPEPEFKKSEFISPFASSCIDISDGLLKDLKIICSKSNVGATIDYEKIPIHNDIHDLTYGDDYVLCFTTSKKNSDNFHEPDFYKIGQITNKKDVEIKKNNKKLEFDKNGWDSFE
ncbi:MAG: thiamine-phosphate kinase, partial [Gammaproteobacteria bacterium]